MSSQLSQLGLLIFVSALVAMLSRRVHLPYTVGLVLAGIGLEFLPIRLHLQLSKALIFTVFLPPLVFEAALHIRWRELKADLPVVVLLATVGLVLAAAVTAIGMHYAVGWEWGSAAVFGVLIAATDPVSVIATFKEARVGGRLRLLVEAESLLNDGTAAVAFIVALNIAAGTSSTVLEAGQTLLWSIGGGILSGAVAGFGMLFLAGRTVDPLVEITFTTLAAYGSFLVAEHFHCSGVLAAMTAGLVTGSRVARDSISEPGRVALESFWEYAAFVANSLIFLLIGAREAQQHFADLWRPALAAIALVTLGRAVAIYPVCALFIRSRLKVGRREQHILFWGGLRGALALALGLGLPQELPHRDAIVAATLAVVAFSIFVQGLTMTPLLRRLGHLPGPEAPDGAPG
ncbi:MAG TPA: sodium:proton antiporter [Steroidobacteraceae bacterium]|jgi:CPA1 family monovalent cation:H+ antiporter|nr:sodium:proton antiporter [Steroidobacteraceae bacterium]